MARIVALPMYLPDPAALDRFWAGLRDAMRAQNLSGIPDDLCRPDDLPSLWRNPDLLLGQTCGYPLVTELSGQVQYVGTPRYSAVGCEDALYSSAVVVRREDQAECFEALRGRRAVINHVGSHSGWNALRATAAPLAETGRFFASVAVSGSHHASMRAVGAGDADVAAIDCVTLALARRNHPALTGQLRVLAWTPRVPGLPLITSLRTTPDEIERLRVALDAVCTDPALASAREALLLDGWERLDPGAYGAISEMETEAARLGYPDLR